MSKHFFLPLSFASLLILEADAAVRHVRLSTLQNINGRTFPFNVLIAVFWGSGYFILNLHSLQLANLWKEEASKVLLNQISISLIHHFVSFELRKIGSGFVFFFKYTFRPWPDQTDYFIATMPFHSHLILKHFCIWVLNFSCKTTFNWVRRLRQSGQGDRTFHCLDSSKHNAVLLPVRREVVKVGKRKG